MKGKRSNAMPWLPKQVVSSRWHNAFLVIVIAALGSALLTGGCEAPATNPALIDATLKPITPPTEADIRAAVERGIAFLIDRQKDDGSWGKMDWRIRNIGPRSLGDFEAFKTATTSLCIRALIEADIQTPQAQAALARAEAWLLVKLRTYRRWDEKALFNSWGHAYAIETLAVMLRDRPISDRRRREIRRLLTDQVRQLAIAQSVHGGWGYYNWRPYLNPPINGGTSFLTATAMLAFRAASDAGIDVPDSTVQRAMTALRWARFPNGAFSYNIRSIPRPDVRSSWPPGAMARSQAGNLAMHVYGDQRATPEVIKAWMTRLLVQNTWLSKALKETSPHSSQYVVAGYYYYYGHYYAARAIAHLPEADRADYRDHLAKILLSRQDKDGCWWDFVLYDYHKYYGTAYALMGLKHCLR